MMQSAKASQKVRVIDSQTNKVLETLHLKPVSIRGFDNFRYKGKIYAAFVNEKNENVIYVDNSIDQFNELETEENA